MKYLYIILIIILACVSTPTLAGHYGIDIGVTLTSSDAGPGGEHPGSSFFLLANGTDKFLLANGTDHFLMQ